MNGYTCPDINKNIEHIKGEMETFVYDMLEEFCPMLSPEDIKRYTESYSKGLYETVEWYIEKVRDTNSELRSSAEKEIERLKDDIIALEFENNELQEEIEQLKEQNEDLIKTVNDYNE